MREFIKSTMSLAWAVPLFGARQIINLAIPPAQQNRTATESFDAATQATGAQLGDLLQSMFQMGDDMQREVTDRFLDMLDPRDTAKTALEIMAWSSEMLKSLGPNKDGRLAWLELRNKVKVFNLVYQVPNTLNLPDKPPYPELSELVERAYALDEYPALWAVEGLGHYYGNTFWKRTIVPQNALTATSHLPDASLTMLHAGIGMAIAQHFLQRVNHFSSLAEIRQVLRRIILLCRSNSKPGYEGAAIESLGLISRSGAFYRETRPDKMVQIISGLLEEMDPDAHGYFWHGVGRSIYFSPVNFLPGYGAIWHPVEMIRREATGKVARRNAFAGLSWGTSMVNIRNPDIVGNLLRHIDIDDEDEREGFKNGILSALMMRQDTTPGAPFISALYRHTPDGSGADFTPKWNDLVRRPCEDALQRFYPVLKQHRRLGDIFRHRDFPAHIDQIISEK